MIHSYDKKQYNYHFLRFDLEILTNTIVKPSIITINNPKLTIIIIVSFYINNYKRFDVSTIKIKNPKNKIPKKIEAARTSSIYNYTT